MTYTSVIIQDAYREGNMVAIGASPSTAQVTEGLRLLNRLVTGVYGNEAGDGLFDWPVGNAGMQEEIANDWTSASWTGLLPNARIVANHSVTQTLYMPPDPYDGARIAITDPKNLLATYPITLNGNGRTIEGAATLVLNTAGLDRSWFYRAEQGDWVRLSALTGTNPEEFPFPEEFDDFFITRLAMRLNPRYGRSMSEDSVAQLLTVERRMRARYRQKQNIPADFGVLALTSHNGLERGQRIVRGRMGWMR